MFMFERKVWRLFAFFTPLSAPLCAFYVFCLSPNKFLLLFLFGVVPKTAFLLLFTPFPLRGGPKSSWPGGRPRHFFKHFWPSPETRLGTVVDSGPLPGDGRTNFAVAGPGARGPLGTISAKLRTIGATTGSGDAAASRRGGRARRRRRRARADLGGTNCQRVRCFCGGRRASARRPARPCRGATHGRAGPQAACNMHVRVPAASGASACARSAPGHGRWRGTHTSRRRSSRSCPRAADPVCARGAGSPSRVLSLTHSLLRVLPATCPSRGHSGGAPTGEQMPVRPSAQPR